MRNQEIATVLCSLHQLRQLTQEEEEESPIAITVMTAEDTTTLRVSPSAHIAECFILACMEFGLCWTKHILLLGGDPLLLYQENDDYIYTLVDDYGIEDGARLDLTANSEATDSWNFQVVVDRVLDARQHQLELLSEDVERVSSVLSQGT